MLKLKTLKFKGIGRFVDQQTIDFEKLGKFTQLDGKNSNTGGSSGAAKSTVFMALDYLFGVSNRPNTVLKSRLSEEVISVEGEFDYDGKDLTISRGKKLSIHLDGETTTGNSAKTEEKLDQILGLSRDLFRKMFHKRQKEGGFFLDMTPSEMNEFLTNSLGLGHFKDKIKIADDKIKVFTLNRADTLSSLQAAQAALRATQDAKLSMGLAPVKEIHQEVVLALKDKATKSMDVYSTMQAAHELAIQELELSRPKIELSSFDRTILSALEDEYETLRRSQDQIVNAEKDRRMKAIRELNSLENQISSLKRSIEQGDIASEKIKEIADQIKQIKNGKCYTCGSDWKDAKKEESLLKEALRCRSIAQEGVSARIALPELESIVPTVYAETKDKEHSELASIVSRSEAISVKIIWEKSREKSHQLEQNKKNNAIQDAFAQNRRSLLESHGMEIEQVRGQADLDRRTFEVALGKLKAYEEARSRYEKSVASLGAQEESYGKKVEDLTTLFDQTESNLAMAEEIKRGLKSYLSCLFDDVLETIGENATTLISSIPNMANASIELEGTKETKDGKIKEEVTAVVHKDGEQAIPIKSFSGGERTSLDLAIDLAVLGILEERANAGANFLALDEPFDGLDSQNVEMVIEMLKGSNSNKKLIIIDHNPETKALVESKLTVVREGATSNIVQT